MCFEQRRQVIAALADRDTEARQVVIADDANLDIARSLGFETIERDNRWLGRRFNDGIEYALSHGAEWIVPLGSDDWIDPDYFLPLPEGPRCSRWYAAVERDRMLRLDLPVGPGRMYPASLLPNRPAGERLRRGVDRSILASVGPVDWERRDVHAMQYIGFRGDRHITTFTKLRAAHGGVEQADPWTLLAERYPRELVEQAQAAMQGVRRPLSLGRMDAWSLRDRLMAGWDRLRP